MNVKLVYFAWVRERIGRAKYIREDALGEFDAIEAELNDQIAALTEGGR